jgi:hypothetical protein
MRNSSRRIVLSSATSVLIAFTGFGFGNQATAASMAKKKKSAPVASKTLIAAGKPCPTIGASGGATAPGLDCVRVGTALQWQPRGSRFNPFHLNEPAEYNSYEQDRYRFVATGTSMLTAADIGAPDPNRKQIPAGSGPIRIGASLTYLGPRPTADPAANLSSYEVVDGAGSGTKFGLYADAACSEYSSKQIDSISLRVAPVNVEQAAGFCVVVPSASMTPALLVHVFWIDNREGLWFKTTP